MSNPKISRKQWAEHQSMLKNLHEMSRLMGKQKVGNATVKLDEFERLRQNFTICAERYQKASSRFNKVSDRIQKAKITYQIAENKHQMQQSLKQMTTITMKLNEKQKRKQKNQKPKKYQTEQNNQMEMDPFQREIQYKNLTIYHLQKSFFKLIKTQRRMPTYRALKEGGPMSLSELKRRAQERPLVDDDEEDLQEREILQALKHIDDMIEQKMDKILQGIQIMNYNAITISQGINTVQKKIMVNLDKVNHNVEELKNNQKRIDQASKHVTKPSCFINVCILLLLGILGYLIVRVVWLSDQGGSDIIK